MYWIIGGVIVIAAAIVIILFLNHDSEKESYDYKNHL